MISVGVAGKHLALTLTAHTAAPADSTVQVLCSEDDAVQLGRICNMPWSCMMPSEHLSFTLTIITALDI